MHRNFSQPNRRTALAAATSLSLTASIAPAASTVSQADTQWWRWRGPTGANHAAPGASGPARIDRSSAAWAVKIPGRGHSSPIVVGDSIYLTTADTRAGTQSVLSFSREGKADWIQRVHQGGLPTENHPKNTEASSTLAFDGEALFGSFYNSGAIVLTKISTDGKVLWQKNVGGYEPRQYKYGYAASPLLYGNTVIVVGDFDGPGFLAALDRQTGETVWKIRRPGRLSFSSPIVTTIAGREQLLLSGADMVASYDPNNGALLWKADGATTMATCGTMVWDENRVYASGGYPKAETVCIAADGSGKVLWSNSTKCYEQSMLAHDGYIYAVADNAIAFCWRASDGKTMWRQRLGGRYSSSPLLVGDKIYVFNESGVGFVFAANPRGFEGITQAKVADEVFASPVVVDDTMYLRVADNQGQRQESLLAFR
ncbi:MAG: PQQ-binding-like beta-propeller repeat protein [Planctomycetota bacterium]